MPPANNAHLYWYYTVAYVVARSGKDTIPSVGKDDGVEIHAAQALGMYDGKLGRTPRRVADLNSAIQTLVTGGVSRDSAAEF